MNSKVELMLLRALITNLIGAESSPIPAEVLSKSCGRTANSINLPNSLGALSREFCLLRGLAFQALVAVQLLTINLILHKDPTSKDYDASIGFLSEATAMRDLCKVPQPRNQGGYTDWRHLNDVETNDFTDIKTGIHRRRTQRDSSNLALNKQDAWST